MFERVIDIYNAKRGENNPRLTKRLLAESFQEYGLTTSYQYGRKIIDAVDSGTQLRINYKILQHTADLCGISLDELFKQF